MANYNRRPLVAQEDSASRTIWLTPDGAFKIVQDKLCPVAKDCYILRERMISRLGDGHMRVHWVEVLSHVDRCIIQESLNLILYPFGSEPSTESAALHIPEDHPEDSPAFWDIPRTDIGGES